MNALWWLYAVLLGAALANIVLSLTLQVKGQLVGRLRIHVPTLLWGLFIAILAMQVWIASVYEQTSVQEVSLLQLTAFLWVPLSTLVMSVLLGEQWWESDASGEALTAEEQFPRVIRAVLLVLFVMIGVNLAHQALSGSFTLDADRAFQALLALVAAVGLSNRRVRESIALPVVALAVLVAYLATVFGTVGVSPAGV